MTLAVLRAEAGALAEALGGSAEAVEGGVAIRLTGDRREVGAPGQPPVPVLLPAVTAAMPALLAALGEAVGEQIRGRR